MSVAYELNIFIFHGRTNSCSDPNSQTGMDFWMCLQDPKTHFLSERRIFQTFWKDDFCHHFFIEILGQKQVNDINLRFLYIEATILFQKVWKILLLFTLLILYLYQNYQSNQVIFEKKCVKMKLHKCTSL